MRQVRDYTEGSITKNIWSLASPMIISQILQTVFYIVDLVFIGMVGSNAIAAVSIATIFMMTLSTVAHGLSIGTTAVIARFIGQRDRETASHFASQSILISVVLGLIAGITAFFFAEFLFSFLGATPKITEGGIGYFKISLLGTFALFLQFTIGSIFRATGEVSVTMVLTVIATLLNLILDPLLIFGVYPFPELGVDGAAWASVIALIAASLTGLAMLAKGSFVITLKSSDFIPDYPSMWRIVKIAVPAASRRIIRDAARMVMMRIVSVYGTYFIAAYGIGMRIDMIAMLPGMGLSAATSTLVGQNLGAGKIKNCEISTLVSLKYLGAIMGSLGIIFYISAPYLISVFDKTVAVLNAGTQYLHYITISYIFVSAIMIFGGALNGAGDSISPLVISGTAAWIIQIPAAVFLSKYIFPGPEGIWFAILITAILESLAFMAWFSAGKWKLKKI